MNISTIEQYVADKNRWSAIFKGPQLSLLNAKDRQRLAASLDADLSPENLTCDGEIRGAQLQAKARFLNRAAAELASIDPTVTFYEYN
jgi:hypothetical protein